jgi:hypothetical protein
MLLLLPYNSVQYWTGRWIDNQIFCIHYISVRYVVIFAISSFPVLNCRMNGYQIFGIYYIFVRYVIIFAILFCLVLNWWRWIYQIFISLNAIVILLTRAYFTFSSSIIVMKLIINGNLSIITYYTWFIVL